MKSLKEGWRRGKWYYYIIILREHMWQIFFKQDKQSQGYMILSMNNSQSTEETIYLILLCFVELFLFSDMVANWLSQGNNVLIHSIYQCCDVTSFELQMLQLQAPVVPEYLTTDSSRRSMPVVLSLLWIKLWIYYIRLLANSRLRISQSVTSESTVRRMAQQPSARLRWSYVNITTIGQGNKAKQTDSFHIN